MLYEIYLLGLIGTFAFSIFGVSRHKKGFDLWCFCFIFPDLNRWGYDRKCFEVPFFRDDNYIFTIIAGTVRYYFYNFIPKLTKYILVVDAMGSTLLLLVRGQLIRALV